MLGIDLQLLAGYIDYFVNWTAKEKEARKKGKQLEESSEFYSEKILWMIMYGFSGKGSADIYDNIYGMVTEADVTPFIGGDEELAELLCALCDDLKLESRARANENNPDDERLFCEALFLDFLNQKFSGMDEDEIYFVLVELGDNK